MKSTNSTCSRRRFLAGSAASVALGGIGGSAAFGAPALRTANKSDSQPLIVGQGDYQYEVEHDWARLPDKFTWQTTHNVAVDGQRNVYVIHEGREDLTDHPSIFVFDADGKYVRSFGNQYQGGGHGIEVRREGGEEFLYVCAYQQVKAFAKLTLQGEIVWTKHAPMESGVYAEGEDTHRQKVWGRDRFMPTNFAFLPDGGFLLADGYGAYVVHRYDQEGNWVSKFGGPGDGDGRFNTPHGIWLDQRGRDEQPRVMVCDRANHTLQVLTLEGRHLQTLSGYGLPANIDIHQDLVLVPELHARITLLGSDNQVVARLGDDVERVTTQAGIRNDPAQWRPGKFVHPHDACFDPEGNIFVAEWVHTGRVSRLKRVV